MCSLPSACPPVKPGRQNKHPCPERTLSMGKVVNGCFAVRITVGKAVSSYFVEPVADCSFGHGFKFVKFDCDRTPGEPDEYHVNLDGTRSTCECKGWLRHGWHRTAEGELTACKHLDALLALVARTVA
jgi:hypothetical protein